MTTSKNILITGAGGFLGLKVVQELCLQGYNVTALSKSSKTCPSISNNNQPTWLIRDIASSPLTTEEADLYDTIIHLAGATEGRGDDRRMHFSANEQTTVGITSQRSENVKKFIYASSQVVYGNPNSKHVDESFPVDTTYSSYATSKINSENWLSLYQAQVCNMTVCLRLSGFLDGGGLIDMLIREGLAGNTIELYGKGQICRDYIHSSYFVELILQLLRADPIEGYSVLNFGTGQAMSAFQIASLIFEIINTHSQIVLSPANPKRLNFVYNTDKLISMTSLFIPSLQEQIIEYTKTFISESASHS